MKLNEKDLEKITQMQKKHKFLKGFTTDEIVDLYLSRCENCLEVCFSVDLVPMVNYKGDTIKCCETCQKQVLDNMFYSNEDYELQQIEDMRME